MILSLLLQINEEPSVKGKTGTELDSALEAKLAEHLGKLKARTVQLKGDITKIEDEDRKKITSEGLREGFNSGHVSKAEKEKEEEEAREAEKKKKSSAAKAKSTSIETLNSPASTSAAAGTTTTQTPDSDAEDDDADDDDIPDLTPMMKTFGLLPQCIPASIPLSATALPTAFTPKHLDGKPFTAALEYLGSHKQLLRQNSDNTTTDAMLVEAFQSEMRGERKRARGFVEKALMLQYLGKLGKDGVNLFFRRMASPDGKAAFVFFNDVLSTYVRISGRCEAIQKEQQENAASGAGGGEEQIQLVAEDPSTVISFEVPEGPAPEKIQLEGESTESLDPERVRDYLDQRWKIFTSFEKDLQEALKTRELEKVNKVLGNMKVERAEEVVGLLDQAGILNFSSAEVRDETGK